MRAVRALALVAALILSGSAARSAATMGAFDAETTTLSRDVPWDGRQELVVESTVGDVRVIGGNRTDVHVEVRVEAPTSDQLAALPIVIEPRPGTILVRVRQPNDGKDPQVRSTLSLAVPSGIAIRALAFEGQVTLERIHGGAGVVVQRGHVATTDLAGRIRLETNSGSVQLARLTPSKVTAAHVRTFNGDVRMTFAERPTDGRLLLLTLNGTITSALPLTERAGFGPRFGEATLGSGEPVYAVDIVRGNIYLAVEGR